MPNVEKAYEENLRASRRNDFVEKMNEEIDRHNIERFRIHVAGDFYDSDYAEKWLQIIRSHPNITFYLYTRSWRVPTVLPTIHRMARQSNVYVWFSCDKDTGVPRNLPVRARSAYLMVDENDVPNSYTHLIFRDHGIRNTVKKRINLSLVCPVENGVTKTTCEKCQVCFSEHGVQITSR